jgi:NAD(P)H-flavin reductase
MESGTATILEIQQNLDGTRQALISWPGGKKPRPGQYVQAFNPAEQDSPAAISIFPGGMSDPSQPDHIWTAAPPIPFSWTPADKLVLRGPLGNGFTNPEEAKRIALVAFGKVTAYLLPIASEFLASEGEVALFTDSSFPQLPSSIEVNPLSALEDGLRWADYLAGCTTLTMVPETRAILRKFDTVPNTEILILSPMPCGAMAACGVCAYRTAAGRTRLVCEDGPVFPWREF